MTNHSFSREPLSGHDRTRTERIQLPFHMSISFRVGIIGAMIGSIFFPLFYFPFLFFQQFYSGYETSISTLALALLSYAVGMLYFFLIMPYHISSMYLRYAMLITFLVAITLSLAKSNKLPFWPVGFANSWPDMLVTLVVIGFFGSFSARALRGYIYRVSFSSTLQLLRCWPRRK